MRFHEAGHTGRAMVAAWQLCETVRSTTAAAKECSLCARVSRSLGAGVVPRTPEWCSPDLITFKVGIGLKAHSAQGNCATSDGAAALSLSEEDAEGLLPLKPWQCLLVVDDNWLMINSGSLWLHNLYLKLGAGKHRALSSFVRAGLSNADWRAVNASDTYVTGVTFHSNPLRTAAGFIMEDSFCSKLIDGAKHG